MLKPYVGRKAFGKGSQVGLAEPGGFQDDASMWFIHAESAVCVLTSHHPGTIPIEV